MPFHLPKLDLASLEAFRVKERRWHAINPNVGTSFCNHAMVSDATERGRWADVQPHCGMCERCLHGIARRFDPEYYEKIRARQREYYGRRKRRGQ